MTHGDVAERLGMGLSTVEKYARSWDIPCSAMARWTLDRRRKRSSRYTGSGNPAWKGGRHLSGGYWYIHAPEHPHSTKKGCALEHRLVMEAHLGRLLLRREVVHHIDGDSLNNAIENLQLFDSNGTHLAHELKGRVPRWSDEGRERILAASRRKGKGKAK